MVCLRTRHFVMTNAAVCVGCVYVIWLLQLNQLDKWTCDRGPLALICLQLCSVSRGTTSSSYMHRCQNNVFRFNLCWNWQAFAAWSQKKTSVPHSILAIIPLWTQTSSNNWTCLALYVLFKCSATSWWWPERWHATLITLQHRLLRSGWHASMQHQAWGYSSCRYIVRFDFVSTT